MTRRPVRVAVIGVGAMGYHHARILHQLQQQGKAELVAVVDRDQKRAEKVAEEFHTKPYTDYHKVTREDPDAVTIALPTSLHAEVATYFAEHGTHILVEKPIADTIGNAKKIIEAARENNVILMVGHVERFNPAVQKLREIIANNELGEIVAISAKRVGPLPPRIKDVGVITDLAVHDIDVIRYITGAEVTEVYARARNTVNPTGLEDAAIIMLTLTNNAYAVIETNWLTPYKLRRLTVTGTKAIAELDYIQQTLNIYKKDRRVEVLIDREEPLKRELSHFIECVRTGKRPLVTGEDGLKALQVAIKAIESARQKEIP